VRVLVVEDDPDLLDLLAHMLRRQGHVVVTAADGEQALARWAAERFDLVLLDLMLPKVDGFEVCRRIRQESDTPIIVLTGLGDEADAVRALELGADAYVRKPFRGAELAAHIEAVMRRAQGESAPSEQPAREPRGVRVAGLVLDPEAHEAERNGERVHLTPLEFRILELLAANAGRVVPYARLVEYAWGDRGGPGALASDALKTHISQLRRKLRLGPEHLRAVPGVGYWLAPSLPSRGASGAA
jgi:DNA-binding response OmpR family regulator